VNQKDVALIRRQFKLDNHLLRIFDIFNVYVTKDSSDIYHHECQPFAMLERDQQELFIGNFKKLLAGQFDQKLFELKFQSDLGLEQESGEENNHTRLILHSGLQANRVDEWKEQMLRLVDKMLQDSPFSEDTVITFIRGEYFKPTKKSNEETEESGDDEVYALGYILCTVNKTEQPKKSLVFDYVSREFRYNVAADPIIKLASPEAGFLFPCFNEGYADVNHVLYAAGKANTPDHRFIEQVLNGELTATAQQDKAVFEDIVREVAGDQLDASTLAHVYEEIKTMIDETEDEEPPRLDMKDVERVLVASGVEDVDAEKVERAFLDVTDNRNYELKASSVIPKFNSKSIKINTKVATIAISPEDLRFVKQVNYRGRRCILIEVDEDTVIEGFTMKTEEL